MRQSRLQHARKLGTGCNLIGGVVVGVATFVVNKGDKLPAEKLVTVPVFDVQSGVKYSNAVAPVLTLNN